MDVATLKAQLKAKQLPSILIFVGDEWEVQKIYLQQIEKITGLEHKRIDEVTDILPALRNKSFTSKNYLYIVRDDKEFMSNAKLQITVQAGIGNNMLVLLVTKLDKRLKFYNAYKDIIVEFEALPEQILAKYIRKQIPKMSDKSCQDLIDVCENDYGRILLELDKIKCYAGTKLPCEDSFSLLLKEGVIYRPPTDAIFDLVAAIMKKQKKSFALLKESYDSGEATMVMLTVLFNTAKAVLQLQTCQSKDVAKATGLNPKQIYRIRELTGHYTEVELEDLLHLIRTVETGIKTGKVEDQFAMQYILVRSL